LQITSQYNVFGVVLKANLAKIMQAISKYHEIIAAKSFGIAYLAYAGFGIQHELDRFMLFN